MDERTNIDDMEQYQEKIKELFVELSSEELARTWADTFDVDEIDEKRITVIYHGTESVKLFKKKCDVRCGDFRRATVKFTQPCRYVLFCLAHLVCHYKNTVAYSVRRETLVSYKA